MIQLGVPTPKSFYFRSSHFNGVFDTKPFSCCIYAFSSPRRVLMRFVTPNLSLSECCTPIIHWFVNVCHWFPRFFKWPCVYIVFFKYPPFSDQPILKASLNDFPGHPFCPLVSVPRCRSQRGGCADRYADRDPAEATANAPGYFEPALKQALKQWGFRPSRFNMKFNHY